jgi:hypothetical protein
LLRAPAGSVAMIARVEQPALAMRIVALSTALSF